MNDLTSKNEIIDDMLNYQYMPVNQDEVQLQNAIKIPVVELSSFGTAFSELSESVRTVTQNSTIKVDNIFKALNLGKDELAKDKAGQLLGQVKIDNLIDRNVRFEKVADIPTKTTTVMPINPATMFLAAAMVSVDKKLDAIEEGQRDIRFFIEQKEESKLQADLEFLNEILSDYKYNSDNVQFIQNREIKALDIKQESKQEIDLWSKKIKQDLSKKKLLHGDLAANIMLSETMKAFANYNKALYLYTFSTFVDVMLSKSFSSDYLDEIAARIEDYSNSYRVLYTEAYTELKGYVESSIESGALGVAGDLNKGLGKLLKDAPLVKDLKVGDAMQSVGDKLHEFKDDRNAKNIQKLYALQNVQVRPFVENLNIIKQLYNDSHTIYFDKDNIYLLNDKVS